MTTRTTFLARLRADKRAVAMTEFALATPLVLTAGLWGVETANYALMTMRVNQVAIQIADNASRIGDTSTLSNQKIYENDINDLLRGSDIQAGETIDLYEHGRVIISSLQVEPGTANDQQYIAWQRCKGKKTGGSSYGVQDTGKNDPTFIGMGPAGEEVQSQPGDAVMFVEIQYDYGPLVTDAFLTNTTINSRAAFQVRASRDLAEIYQRDPASPDEIARCDVYDSYKETPPPPRTRGGWDWEFSDAPGTSSSSGGSGSSASSSGGSGNGNGNSSSGNNNGSSGNNSTTEDPNGVDPRTPREIYEDENNCTYGPFGFICWPNG